MEYWEFLLQKEGDRAWLPLESPLVEILEGRYRIIARSSYCNAEVSVRASYLPSGETPLLGSRPRLQQRRASTNSSGLIAIAPFTLLKAGLWEFSCRSQGKEPWQYVMRLQVAPSESEVWEEAPLPDSSPEELDPQRHRSLLSLADRLMEQMVEPEALAASLPPAAVPPVAAPVPPPAPLPSLRLRLDRATYVTDWHQPLLLAGVLEADAALPRNLEWRVILRDPTTQRIVVRAVWSAVEVIAAEAFRDGEIAALPCRFACGLTLPIEANTFLLLGELTLYGSDRPDAAPLAVETFTVSAEAEALLAAIEPNFEPRRPAPAPTGANLSLDFQFLDLVSRPPDRLRPFPVPALPEPPAPPAAPPPAPPAPAPLPSAPPPLDSEQPFGQLRLGDRFWNRLSALAEDEPLADWLRSRSPSATPPKPEARDPDAELTRREVVFDDGQPSPPASDPRLSPEHPIPAPTVDITNEAQLRVGGTLALRVRVPEGPARLWVRLWVEDRRSREVVVSPRSLLEFFPNGLDELETRLEVQLPPQVLEIAVGAIAVEMLTGRESAKTERRAALATSF